jgi:hypothetical protein
MATDLTVVREDRPGTLARLGKALGDSGVNIDLIYVATNTRLVYRRGRPRGGARST